MFNDLPKNKTESYKKVFDMHSKGQEGCINTSDLANIFKSINIDASDEELKEIIKKMDLEEKKEINYEEFLNIINQREKDVDQEEEVIKAFKVFDKDGNGLININELKDIMLNFGNNWSEEELNEMFKEADIDMDGYLNYEEFVRTMLSK